MIAPGSWPFGGELLLNRRFSASLQMALRSGGARVDTYRITLHALTMLECVLWLRWCLRKAVVC
jgi:hypothetical protein